MRIWRLLQEGGQLEQKQVRCKALYGAVHFTGRPAG